jgi:hypothetical protein
VGGEEHLAADDLLHFRRVPVREQPVRREVLVDAPEVQRLLEAAAGARDARGRIDDDAGGFHQPLTDQRGEGQAGRGGIAPGRRHQSGSGQVVPEQLGQPVDGLSQQGGRAVVLAVPLRIEPGVLQPEIGGQVDDHPHPAPELGDDLLGLPVGQATENQVEAVEPSGVAVLVDQAGVRGRQGRGVGADRLAGMRVRRRHGDLEFRVARQEAEQLRPGVPRCSKDPCLHRMSIHISAYSWD